MDKIEDNSIEDMERCCTKAEILENIKEEVADIYAAMANSQLPSAFYMAKIRIMQELESKVRDMEFLPLPNIPNWTYFVYSDEYGAKVELMYGAVVEGNAKLQRIIFAEVKANMLDSETYGKLHSASPTLVRQWIRRGKLPNAKKTGAVWRISELAVPKSRGYDFRVYVWNRSECIFEDDLAFLNAYDGVSIEQNKDGSFAVVPRTNDKCGYLVNAYPLSEKPEQDSITMTQKQKEAFELKLIEHPYVKHTTSSAFLQ